MLLELDAGERDDESEQLWRLFDLLNVACGGHAGDDASMRRVLGACARYGIAVGAHPSYPDREGFGRRSIEIAAEALEGAIAEQCAALRAIAGELGIAIGHVKPHGALYHDATRDPALARAVVHGALAGLAPASQGTAALAIIGPATGALADAARAAGLRYLVEGFADRGTRADGSLIPRGERGALIDDPTTAAARARELASRVEALCVHADTPGALAIAQAVRAAVRASHRWLGDRAIRFARPTGVAPAAIVETVRAWPGVVDVVVARDDIAAYFDRDPRDAPLDTAIAALAELRDAPAPPSRELELHAAYDGPDLADVARAAGFSVDEVIRRHARATYVVETIGFAPGFAYMSGLDAELVLPRRATPRTRVPAGSLAIAGEHTAVYPFDSPGGWHLIGRVDEPMFDREGSRLRLGDRVRFVGGTR